MKVTTPQARLQELRAEAEKTVRQVHREALPYADRPPDAGHIANIHAVVLEAYRQGRRELALEVVQLAELENVDLVKEAAHG